MAKIAECPDEAARGVTKLQALFRGNKSRRIDVQRARQNLRMFNHIFSSS
jgi:hypothetical protein